MSRHGSVTLYYCYTVDQQSRRTRGYKSILKIEGLEIAGPLAFADDLGLARIPSVFQG